MPKPKTHKPKRKREKPEPVALKRFDRFLGEILRAKPLSKEVK